jgi:hypothetical protein
MVSACSRRLAIPRHIASEQERFPIMMVVDEMAATPHDDVTRRIVELWRMMAHFDYVDLLLVVRVAESLMREQPMSVASAQRSGLRDSQWCG